MHSFTPVFKGVPRPWHAGLLYNRDPRFAQILIALLKRKSSAVGTISRFAGLPARYCIGYLGDIGVVPDPALAPMDFSAWFEVFLEGRWYTFDARHNHPRIGRVMIARGRDAADVAISTIFGPSKLIRFKVVTEETDPGQWTQRSVA